MSQQLEEHDDETRSNHFIYHGLAGKKEPWPPDAPRFKIFNQRNRGLTCEERAKFQRVIHEIWEKRSKMR